MKNKDEQEHIEEDLEVVLEEDTPALVIKKLRERLKKCEEESREYLDGWQRSKADFVNARKIEEKEKGEFREFANLNLIEKIVPVLDSFHMAFGNKEAWEKVDANWRQGVEYIYSQLTDALKSEGFELIDTKGIPFDTTLHHSLETISTDKKDEDHMVAEVVTKGYRIKQKTIKPAKVKVYIYQA